MKKKTKKLFKEITVWKRIDDSTLVRYRCLQVLPDNRYCVKCSDFFYWPLDEKLVSQQDRYYIDSLFQDALEVLAKKNYETLEEAIQAHEQEFGNQ